MNTFDKISFKNAYIDGFDVNRLKLPILSTITGEQYFDEHGSTFTIWNVDTSSVHGLTMLSVNEYGFCNFAITGKFQQELYREGITEKTLSKTYERLNECVYPEGFSKLSLLSTEIGLVDTNIDVEIEPKTMQMLRAFKYHPTIYTEVQRNGNIIYQFKNNDKLRLTIYDKRKEFDRPTKANNELRNHNVEPPPPNTYRFELRIPTLNAIRRTITGNKRLQAIDVGNPNRKAPLVKPTLSELFFSSKNAVVDVLKQILSNVMFEPGRETNYIETIVYLAYENRDFSRMRTRAYLIHKYGKSMYENKFSKILTQIESECKALKPNGDTVTEVLECLKR